MTGDCNRTHYYYHILLNVKKTVKTFIIQISYDKTVEFHEAMSQQRLGTHVC